MKEGVLKVGILPDFCCCEVDCYLFEDRNDLDSRYFDDIVDRVEKIFFNHSETVVFRREKNTTLVRAVNVSVDFCAVSAPADVLVALVNVASNQFVKDDVKIRLCFEEGAFGDDAFQELEIINFLQNLKTFGKC